jgi:hypothetical protein
MLLASGNVVSKLEMLSVLAPHTLTLSSVRRVSKHLGSAQKTGCVSSS